MGAIALEPIPNLQIHNDSNSKQHGAVVEEIEGLIKVYKDGHVERSHIVPHVPPSLPLDLGVVSKDVKIDSYTNIWARFYVPKCANPGNKLPLIVYFHGGGFCVGSASWLCYHEFLAKLAGQVGCIIMSVNYRLAPENPLPAAYEDGLQSLLWLKQRGNVIEDCLQEKIDFSAVFLAGDSAGGNIAYNVTARSANCSLKPLIVKGVVLIQPFFGGEGRTDSEKFMVQSSRSALTVAAADTYWRLALPGGADRDHLWCNPLGNLGELRLPRILVCVSEIDVLRDRNLEVCAAMVKAGIKVEQVVYGGVGHAFQVLSKSKLAQVRTQEMMDDIKAFIS